MAKDEKKKTDKWVAQLQIVAEDKPPVKTIVDTEAEEVYTIEAAIAKLLNEVTELKEGLL